ncbi:MAG: hypothetical protein PVF19_09460 [Gemmatimonadota bacterium]|jgi:uncharacterized protein YbaR (Trm112 family)
MDRSLLEILRCPYCGTPLSLEENDALLVDGDRVEQGVLGCECCAFPVVAGIPVLMADDAARDALHALEDDRAADALLGLLGAPVDDVGREAVGRIVTGEDVTYKEALATLCDDAEGTYFLYRLTDPTYVAAEGVLRAIAQPEWPFEGRVLDLCGGSGHLTRVLSGLRPGEARPTAATVLADLHFWKLWLARRYVAPDVEAVCCDANSPLPFARGTFTTVVLTDAFPYIWHKRMLAGELTRLVGADGVVVMPHLHSALGENYSAGDTLTPAAYRALFERLDAHLFGDSRVLDDLVRHGVVDLTREARASELEGEPSVTLIASGRDDLFERYELGSTLELEGELAINPLYRVEPNGASATLTLTFPNAEYEAEFGACRRYLPERVSLDVDLALPLTPDRLGSSYTELRDRRVVIDAPEGYGL